AGRREHQHPADLDERDQNLLRDRAEVRRAGRTNAARGFRTLAAAVGTHRALSRFPGRVVLTMGGCTNCKGKAGCDHRKGSMLESVDRTLEMIYPTKTWGEPEDGHSGFMSWGELHGLTEELAGELNAATFLREGIDDE